MTEDMTFERFLTVLDAQVVEARSCMRDARAFLDACEAIADLLDQEWPALQSQITQTGLTKDQRAKLAEVLADIAGLESKTLAKIAWSDDLESYMRRDIEGAG